MLTWLRQGLGAGRYVVRPPDGDARSDERFAVDRRWVGAVLHDDVAGGGFDRLPDLQRLAIGRERDLTREPAVLDLHADSSRGLTLIDLDDDACSQ